MAAWGSGPTATRIDWDQCIIVPSDAASDVAGDSAADRGPARAPDAGRPATQKGLQQPANDLTESILQRLVIDDSDPFFIASVDGCMLYANELYAGLAADSGGVLPEAPRRGSRNEATVQVQAALQEAASMKRAMRYSERLILDGEERHYTVKYLPVFDQDKEVIAVVASLRDTTAETRQIEAVTDAQQRFRDFARATSDWFWEVDRSFRVRALSERFAALTSQPTAMVLDRRLDELGSFKPNIYGDETIYAAVKRRISFRDQLMEMEVGDGEIMFFHLSGVPVFDRVTGEFDGYRGAGMDVTQRYEQAAEALDIREDLETTLAELTLKNRQLDIATGRAESALRTKNEFLASMSHELRTPLNAIIGFAETMKLQIFGDLNGKYQIYSNDIMNAGKHLLGLIEDILDVAVLETGEISLTLEDASLNEVVEQAKALSMFRAQNKNLDLSRLKIDRDFTVYVDKRRATQVFVNLLINAMKYTPDGGTVGLEVQPANEGLVAVTIWDTGVGIPEDKQDIVFEKFRQVNDNVYSRSVEGTGLGLHISRELAKRMGGDLTVVSESGRGSRFTVTLPLSRKT